MGFQRVAKQLLARSGRAALVPVLLVLVGGFWLLAPVGAAPADVTDVSIDPTSDTNAVNTLHEMTATVAPVEAGVVVRFRVFSGPNATDDGVGVTNGSGQASLSYVGDGGVGTDTILVWVDADNDGNADVGEPLAVATATWTSGVVTSLALTPEADTNPVDTLHTVTATLTPAEGGLIVRFKVATGPNTGKTGVALTDTGGDADYTYLGDGGTGVDTIVAWADLDNDSQLDSGEATDTATKLWTDSEVDAITLSPVSDTNPINTGHTVTATLSPIQAGVLIQFEVSSGPNSGDSGSEATGDTGKAEFTYTGDGGVGGDVIIAWADLDTDGVLDAEEPATVAAKYWVNEVVSGISLAPTTDSHPVGTLQTLTATVSPVQSGVVVRFALSSGPNVDESGLATTSAQGKATFSYVGDGGVGTDLILAWADLDNDGNVDAGEPQATALKQWTTVTIVGLTLTPATDENPAGTLHHLTGTVNPKVAGALVRMEVVAGPNTGATDSDRTNSSGEAKVSYRGDGGEGTDLILAWVDLDNDGVVDSGEQQATATKVWTPGGPGAVSPEDVIDACENLTGGSHPSLQALCDVLATGEVSEHTRAVIEGIILRKAGWAFPGSNGHCRDRDDGRGRGHEHHDDDERCGEGVDADDDDHDRGRGWGTPGNKDDDDED